jgi:hypothetical protein
MSNSNQFQNDEDLDDAGTSYSELEFIKKHAQIFYKPQSKVIGDGKQFGT